MPSIKPKIAAPEDRLNGGTLLHVFTIDDFEGGFRRYKRFFGREADTSRAALACFEHRVEILQVNWPESRGENNRHRQRARPSGLRVNDAAVI